MKNKKKIKLAKKVLYKIAWYNLSNTDPLRDCAIRQWALECYRLIK